MTARIICVQCRQPLYDCLAVGRDFSGADVLAEDMVPVSSSIPAPQQGQEMKCPLCGGWFFHVVGERGVVLELEGGAFWPHPPLQGVTNGRDEETERDSSEERGAPRGE